MNKVPMKILRDSVFTTVMILVVGLSACTDSQKEKKTEQLADSTTDLAEDRNDAKFDESKKDDADFMMDASECNLMEIQLGKLAQKNAVSSEVKKLGKTLEKHHSNAQKDLQGLADKKQVSLPAMLSGDGKETENNMTSKTGTEFEREYCDKTVKSHEDIIKKFEKASLDAEDPELKNWAATMLPTLREHLDMAITCQKKANKKS